MNSVRRWSFTGFIAITLLGFLLHYLYEWSGSSGLIGLFVPVNESVWEHLKLGYWSIVLFSIPEYFQIRNSVNNYFLAKLIGVVSLELAMILFYYGYTSLIAKHILLLDITSYILGAVICQVLTYLLFRQKKLPSAINRISLTTFIALGLLFSITTYHPPHNALFKDANTNSYGIGK